MREVLFRGKLDWHWDGINIFYAEEAYKDGWVYGQLARNAYGMAWIIGDIVNWSEGHICPKYWIPVDPKTVGRYTGLKDKNGVKIFEGDVLGGIVGGGVVVWIDRETRYGISLLGEVHEVYLQELEQADLEVIGNVHDNFELLEVGD
jgi:hypothetical protein